MRIGIFDSGFGGSSVLKHIIDKTNFSNFIYYADRKNAPYGLREKNTIYKWTKQGVSFLIKNGADIVILACNTATASSLPQIEREFSVPIIGIHPPIFDAIEIYNEKNQTEKIPNILVYATMTTLGSEHVIQNIHKIEESNKARIELLSCSDIVPYIEDNKIETEEFEKILKKSFDIYKNKTFDAFLFSCTHLPLIDKQIYNALGYKPNIILDGSEYIIERLQEYEKYIKQLSEKNNNSQIAFKIYETKNEQKENIKLLLHDTKEGSEAFDIFSKYIEIDKKNIIAI